MRYLLLFSLFFLVANFSFGQKYYKLYGKYLPEAIFDHISKESIDLQFEKDACLDPHLIYWHIEYYNKTFAQKDTSKITNGLNYYWHLSSEAAAIKNKWIEEQSNL